MPEKVRDPATGEEFFIDSRGRRIPNVDISTVGPNFRGNPMAAFGVNIAPAARNLGPEIAAGVMRGVDMLTSAFGGGTSFEETASQIEADIEGRRNQPMLEAARRDQPIPSMLGEGAGGSVVPGGRVVQGVVGTAQGLSIPGTPAQRLATGALVGTAGVLGSGTGRRIGDELAQQVMQRSANMRTRSTARAVRNLQRQGFPLSEGDRAFPGAVGDAARTRDIARTTMSGEPVVNAMGKSDVVNRGLLAPTGVNSTIVDDAALGAIKGRYDALYGGVRRAIADPVEPSQFDDLLKSTSELMAQRVPEERFYRAVEGLQTAIQGNRMDGNEYLRIRSELGKFARATDDDVSADMYYGVIRGLDNVMEEQGAVGLRAANELWRYRQVLQGPGVLNDATGNVNLVSYLRQMRRMFPGIRDGNAPQNMQDAYALARDAQMFAGFQDSGTARRSLVPGEQLLREGALQLRLQPSEMLGGGVGRAAGQSVQDGDSETE